MGYSTTNTYKFVNPAGESFTAIEMIDSYTPGGFYQFKKYPEKNVEDDFDGTGGTSTCASGADGDSPWNGNWSDSNDPSNGFCNTSQSAANTDVEIVRDGAFGFAISLKDNGVYARRSINLNNATKAFLTFAYRRKNGSFGVPFTPCN